MIAKVEPQWEPPETSTETQHFFLCPACKKHRHSYGHLLEGRDRIAGPWYCHEPDCGVCCEIHVTADNKILVKAHPDKPRWVPKLVLLKRENIYLVVEHTTFEDHADENHRFYFNEHTCPTNYFRATRAILIPPHDNDPHGLFEFVASAPATIKDIPNTAASTLFEHFGLKFED